MCVRKAAMVYLVRRSHLEADEPFSGIAIVQPTQALGHHTVQVVRLPQPDTHRMHFGFPGRK